MSLKAIAGASLAVALIGAGALAGSVVGSANAQAPVTATPGAGTGTAPSTNPSGNVPNGGPHGFRGGHGGGHEGMGGFEGMRDGFFGGNATVDNATNSITRATTALTTVQGDLAYAKGKMDTADIERWITGADALITDAKTASTSTEYGKAVAYAAASADLSMTAESQMAQALGADKLPSYATRPQQFGKGGFEHGMGQAANTTLTQAQASRMLARTYQQLVMQKSVITDKDALTYLKDAQDAYKTAYASYGAGKYTEAANSARLAERLAEIANRVQQAGNVGKPDVPVTVPSPNF